jgi:hypothetical protein
MKSIGLEQSPKQGIYKTKLQEFSFESALNGNVGLISKSFYKLPPLRFENAGAVVLSHFIPEIYIHQS